MTRLFSLTVPKLRGKQVRFTRSWGYLNGRVSLLPEDLRVLDEPLECRDNNQINLVKNKFQEVINRQVGRIPQVMPLIEGDKRSEAAIHIHGFIRFIPTRRGFDHCAMVQCLRASTGKSAAKSNNLIFSDSGANKIHAPVLVDVGEMKKKSQTVIDATRAIVRLNTLNECKRLIGNPRKLPGECTLRNR